MSFVFFFSSRRRHTRSYGDWSSDVCSSDLAPADDGVGGHRSARSRNRNRSRRLNTYFRSLLSCAILGYADAPRSGSGPDPGAADRRLTRREGGGGIDPERRIDIPPAFPARQRGRIAVRARADRGATAVLRNREQRRIVLEKIGGQ